MIRHECFSILFGMAGNARLRCAGKYICRVALFAPDDAVLPGERERGGRMAEPHRACKILPRVRGMAISASDRDRTVRRLLCQKPRTHALQYAQEECCSFQCV